MKTTSQKKKKKGSKKSKRSGSNPKVAAKPKVAPSVTSKEATQKKLVTTPKKVPDKRREEKRSKGILKVVMQFLREAKFELKKVKWPTRKELLASTAMVIFLVLVISLYLGLVDFGLIKILKLIVG